MTYIAPRTEKLARAMCEALGKDPDDKARNGVVCRWELYEVDARLWIYEYSGGELPEREG